MVDQSATTCIVGKNGVGERKDRKKAATADVEWWAKTVWANERTDAKPQ